MAKKKPATRSRRRKPATRKKKPATRKKKPATRKKKPAAESISAEIPAEISQAFSDLANGPVPAATPDPDPESQRSPNREYDQVEAGPSRCKKCHSTNRERYFGQPQVRDFQTVQQRPSGERFNRLVRRRTKCADCGQYRFDLSYEFDASAAAAADAPAPAFLNMAAGAIGFQLQPGETVDTLQTTNPKT